jgi:chromosome segregation protein
VNNSPENGHITLAAGSLRGNRDGHPSMYLKEIVANGFKSFADRTRIELGPGVTAVVGPNGCGKSNIVDAIRWVLGEQSAKSLRGQSMQDVIFAGTDRRKPMPQCEVELVFADCEKELGTAFAEVSVMRRLYREGTSDYFLNGKPARLKDIQRLFMDTGIGRMSYSFMVQGQIDQVLSANPAERRYLFEEAAGITRYKSQRKEALNKLSGVDTNLARVTDVIGEVGRQIASLRRQAAKALRYRRLRHRFSHLDLAWQSKQFADRKAQVEKLEVEATSCRTEVETLAESLRSREAALASTRAARIELAEQVQRAQQSLFDLRTARENAEADARTADLRSDDLTARLQEIRREAAEAEQAIVEYETRLRGSSDVKSAAAGDVTAADATFREKAAEVDELGKLLIEAEVRLRRTRQDVLVAEGEMTRARADVTNFEVDLRGYQARLLDLTASLSQARDERVALDRRASESATAASQRHADLQNARATEQAAADHVRELLNEFRSLQQTISEQDRQVAKLSAQLGVLEQMQSRLEGFSDAAKAVLRGELSEGVPAGKAAALADLVTVTDVASAGALENILGAASEAVALESAEFLPGIISKMGERELGRAVFQVAAPGLAKSSTASPSWLRPATQSVQPKAAAHARIISNLFDGCYICDSLADFLGWWRSNPTFEFFLVATTAGDLVDRRGLVFAGRPRKAASGAGSGVFSRESEIRAVKAKLEAENDKLTTLNEKALGLQSNIETAEASVTSQRSATEFASQELSVAQADERTARSTLTAADERIARDQRQFNETESSKADAVLRRDRAQDTLTVKDGQVAGLRQSIIDGEQEVERRRGEADNRRSSLGEVRLSLAEQRQRLELAGRELADLESRRADASARLASRKVEAQNNDRLITELKTQATVARENSQKLSGEIDTAHAALNVNREELSQKDTLLESEDRVLSVDRERLRETESRLKSLEVSLAEQTSQCGFISEKVLSDHQVEVGTVDWRLQLWLAEGEPEGASGFDDLEESEEGEAPAAPKSVAHRGEPKAEDLSALENVDWPPLVREIADLRDRMSGMGSINLVAVEEYSSLRDRHEFLTKQSDDLWKAKEELTKAIDELNQTSLKLFTDTFEQVRKNFKFTFERLFVGGAADLKLVQAEDPLESGIEIIAQPPGTKLRGISLLSGGQRTMTAVALLFAIYMVKPSPLCVLDELDAPLDDANVGRFTDIIRDFTKFSQFLVITHNKRTVSAADAIFGATMQEKGVTRLFSMRFNSERDEAEPTQPGGGFTMAR